MKKQEHSLFLHKKFCRDWRPARKKLRPEVKKPLHFTLLKEFFNGKDTRLPDAVTVFKFFIPSFLHSFIPSFLHSFGCLVDMKSRLIPLGMASFLSLTSGSWIRHSNFQFDERKLRKHQPRGEFHRYSLSLFNFLHPQRSPPPFAVERCDHRLHRRKSQQNLHGTAERILRRHDVSRSFKVGTEETRPFVTLNKFHLTESISHFFSAQELSVETGSFTDWNSASGQQPPVRCGPPQPLSAHSLRPGGRVHRKVRRRSQQGVAHLQTVPYRPHPQTGNTFLRMRSP